MPTSTPTPACPIFTAAPAPVSHLMNLPTELRLQIFSYILPEPDSSPPKLHPQILATCRKCRNEAEPLLYEATSFHLEDDPLSTDYRIRSLTHGEETRLGRRFWQVVQYFQEILPMLRKFRRIQIWLPVLRDWRAEEDVAVPIDGLLYILGSLLEGSASKILTFVQEIDGGIDAETVRQAEDFDWSAPFLGPSVTITCSGFTTSTALKMQSLAAKPQNNLTNVLLPWINLKRQVQDLFVLLENAKMRCPAQGLLLKHMVEGDNGCARLEVLSLSKRKAGKPYPLDKGFQADCVQTALEGPLAKLQAIVDEQIRDFKSVAVKKLTGKVERLQLSGL